MKILALCFLMTGFAVQAAPRAGDQAVYNLRNKNSAAEPETLLKMTQEVLSVDSGTQTLQVRQTTTDNGSIIQQDTHSQAIGDLLDVTPDQLSHCADFADFETSAVIETVQVIAGRFQTCHLKSKKADADGFLNDFYLSTVPFGFVKSSQNNATTGATQSLELISYRKN